MGNAVSGETVSEAEDALKSTSSFVANLRRVGLYSKLKARFPNEDEADLKEAVRQCNTLEAAITFLNRECGLCANFVPQTKMTAMLTCEHVCCDSCAANYFKVQIKEKCITEAKCPYCDEPKEEDMLQDYYMWLEETLKSLLNKGLIDSDVLTLFHKKLARNHLEKDPLFRWCSQCDNGMLMDDMSRKRILCGNCNKETCCECKQPWQEEHERMSCKEFAQWKRDNSEDAQIFDVEKQLETEGIQCPNCNQRYLLSRGGCLHFKCPNCSHEFCSGCGNQFSRGAACLEGGERCRKQGMHAHHPSNCFYYLRDKEIDELHSILDGNGISYDHLHLDKGSRLCPVVVQKEAGDGFKDEQCGKEKHKNASFCKYHYAEKLCLLMKRKDVNTEKRGKPTNVSSFVAICFFLYLLFCLISVFLEILLKFWRCIFGSVESAPQVPEELDSLP